MLLDIARAFLEDASWSYEEHPQEQMIRAFHEGDHGTFPVYIRADDDRDQLIVYGVLPDCIAEPQRLAVGAVLAGLNYGLTIGNFEIDFNDGEVRFRTSVDVEGGDLTSRMVRSLTAACILNLDFYRPAIERVALEQATPLEVLNEVGG